MHKVRHLWVTFGTSIQMNCVNGCLDPGSQSRLRSLLLVSEGYEKHKKKKKKAPFTVGSCACLS